MTAVSKGLAGNNKSVLNVFMTAFLAAETFWSKPATRQHLDSLIASFYTMHAMATICTAPITQLAARKGRLERVYTAPLRTRTVGHPAPRGPAQPAAIPPEVYTLAAEVGEVDAPVWVLPVAYVCTAWCPGVYTTAAHHRAIIVTIGLSLSSFLLKPGVCGLLAGCWDDLFVGTTQVSRHRKT